jgi:uncharacterized membrane protein
MPIPFGFFGSLVFLLAVEAVLTTCFVFVWPGVHARPLITLASGVLLGAFVSIALWLWFLSPLNGIGIAGENSADGQSPDVLKASLQQRYALVVLGVVVTQISAMAALRLWIGAARA